MATADQTHLDQYGRLDYALGDLIEPLAGNGHKLRLTECPLCAADPSRPRHHFDAQDKRAVHIATHDASDLRRIRG